MRNLIILLILSSILLIACEGEGQLRVNNYTKHTVYFTFENKSYALPDSTYYTVSKDIKKSWNPFKSNEKKVDLTIFGETFVIEEDGEEKMTTQVTLEAGKTLNVYANPNRACVELQNLTDYSFVDFHYQKFVDGEYSETSENILDGDVLESNEYVFHRLEYSTTTDEITYVFSATDEYGITSVTGEIELFRDDKYYFIIEED